MINRAVSFVASIAVHACVLWLYKPGDNNIPLAAGEMPGESVEVELVDAGAPLEPPPVVETPPEPTPPEPQEKEVTPPDPTPPPEPKPELPPPPPDAIPEPTPAPVEPPKPKPKPVAKPAPRPAAQPPKSGPVRPIAGAVSAGAVPGSSAGSADGDSVPRYKNKVKPVYPPSLRRSGSRGRVVITAVISAQGRTISARVTESSGNPLFEQAALAAARASEFYPKKTLGVAVEGVVIIPYEFAVSN
jgi:protein TonB